MMFHKQLLRHRPDEGLIGDCWRTCLACLLDLSPSEVPHFADHGMGDPALTSRRTREWLARRGLDFVEIPFLAENGPEAVMMAIAANASPDFVFIFGGQSANGVNHAVLARNGVIVWGTALDDSGILGPCTDGHYWATFLVPKLPLPREVVDPVRVGDEPMSGGLL